MPPPPSVNVFHFTATNNNCCNDGDRIPSLWVSSDGKFNFRSTLGHTYYAKDVSFVLGKSYHITIQQSNDGGKYWYEIIVDGHSHTKLENNLPKTYPTVNLYTGSNWLPPFSLEFGTICNLKIKQGKLVAFKQSKLTYNSL